MGNVQPNYNATMDIGYEGQIADMRSYDGVSRICESASIGFGLAVIKGTGDKDVKLGAGGLFIGLTVRDIALPAANEDAYLEGNTVGVMTRGTMFCKAVAAVNAGDDVFYTSTGTLTNVIGARTATAVADEGNTGNGAMGAITVSGDLPNGDYTLKIIKAASGAGEFTVSDANGNLIGVGNVATAFSQNGLAFTLADDTDFVVGDVIVITVTGGNTKIEGAIWEKTLAQNAIGPVRLH